MATVTVSVLPVVVAAPVMVVAATIVTTVAAVVAMAIATLTVTAAVYIAVTAAVVSIAIIKSRHDDCGYHGGRHDVHRGGRRASRGHCSSSALSP